MAPEDSLTAMLRELHLQAGKPSTRKIAEAVGGVSHTTVNDMLKGSRVPAWGLVEKVGRYLLGDVDELHELWMAAQKGPPALRQAHNDLWDPVYLERIVVTSLVSAKGTLETRTVERWITATSDAVDRYVVTAAAHPGRSHRGMGKVDVEPYLNCEIGEVRRIKAEGGADALRVDVLLARPLNTGERGFFATISRYEHPARFTSFTETKITGQGAREVLMRVQFSFDSVPVRCWGYVGVVDVEMFDEPPAGSPWNLDTSPSGYVELNARDLPSGARVGIVWTWD